MSAERRMEYALADRRAQFRIAAENPAKTELAAPTARPATRRAACSSSASTSTRSRPSPRSSARRCITGKTPQRRTRADLRSIPPRRVRCIVLSKVGNFAIDLPGRRRAHPGLGHVRVAPGRGAAARAHPAAQGRRPRRALLHAGLARHARGGVRPPPQALPDRAGILVPGRRRRWILSAERVIKSRLATEDHAANAGSDQRSGPAKPTPAAGLRSAQRRATGGGISVSQSGSGLSLTPYASGRRTGFV